MLYLECPTQPCRIGSVETMSENATSRKPVTILVVHHSPTEKAQKLADTVLAAARAATEEVNVELGAAAGGEPGEGAGQPAVQVLERQALEPDVEELRGADAVILGTTANFGYISGALKHYFDTVYVPVLEEKKATPTSWWIRGGYDTTGAEKAMRSILTGLEWETVAEPVEFTGDIEPHLAELEAMAQAVVGQAVASII